MRCKSAATKSVLIIAVSWTRATSAWADPSHIPPVPDTLWTPSMTEAFQRIDEDAPWPSSERKAYSELLSGEHREWLLAPTQVQMQGLGRAERSEITVMLAQSLEDAGVEVPNTFLVERALGDGRRSLRPDTIDALAQRVGAPNIIVPYAGHDGSGHLTLTLAVYRKPSLSAPLNSKPPIWLTWSGVKFSDQVAPVIALAGLRAEILQGLGFSGGAQNVPSASKPMVLPDSPEGLLTGVHSGDAMADAAALAVLAVTVPPTARAAERLYERAFLAAMRAPDSAEQRFLSAYALFRLGLRPNALNRLSLAHRSPASASLAALINGNLTGTAELVQHTSGYQRFILEFELHDLARLYGHDESKAPPALLKDLATRSDWWAALIGARWDYLQPLGNLDNAPLKQLLDRHYPVPGQSLEDLISAHAVTPGQGDSEATIQTSVLRHVRSVLFRDKATLCCRNAPEQINALDLVSVVESWAQLRAMKSIDTDLNMRGLPERAIERMNALESVYAGLPDFEVLRAEAESAIAQKSADAAKPIHLQEMRAHALSALFEAGGQTSEASEAMALIYRDSVAADIAADYLKDFPFNPNWFAGNPTRDPHQGGIVELRAALANTQIDAGYLDTMLLIGGEDLRKEVAAELRERFLGSPVADNIRDKLTADAAGPDADLRILQARVRKDADTWEPRLHLGSYLVLQGDYAGALAAFASFPGFNDRAAADRISLSNEAKQAGSLLFWHGALPQARQMLGIAKSYGTGSEAELIAALQLALIDGDLAQALSYAYQRAERYPTASAYSTYLSLLHLTGHSADAWKSFDLLVGQPLGPGLWESAIVGLRVAGTTPDQLNQWLLRPQISHAENRGLPWQASFLMSWSTTDREAATDLVARIRALAHEPRGIVESMDGRSESYPRADRDGRYLVSRSDFRSGQRLPVKDQSPIESELPPFAAGVLALQRGNFSGAVSEFDQVAARFPVERHIPGADAAYVLPDFAYASAKSGDPLKLEPFVAGLPEQIFESLLARGYFQALAHHDAAAAKQSLKKAFGLMEHYVGRTPATEYQYAEAVERIYRDTGDTSFRDLAIAWAHTVQRLQPWQAWAYAIEAELRDKSAERDSALDKALFLDPLSPRLRGIAPEILQQARNRLGHSNPFALPVKPGSHAAGTTTARSSVTNVGMPASG